MMMDIMLEPGAKLPTRAHDTDAGLDLYALHDGVVRAHQSATFRTGVHVALPKGTMGDIRPKSGLMFGRDLLTFGTVDEGYSGEIMIHLFNLGDVDQIIHTGDKIAQMVVVNVRYESVYPVDSIIGGKRGDNGFGSTGR
jgi:dUTP pyrophosphatase